MNRDASQGQTAESLSERQALVLRAVVTAYVGEAAPIGSKTLSYLLPIQLSSATIRAALAELMELGLVEQPHSSAGRVPTERGLRYFVDELLEPGELEPSNLGAYEMRAIAHGVDDAAADAVVNVTSQLLSERTHQLGFVVAPRIDRVVLRHVSLVRLSPERVLVVLVSRTGAAHRRVIEDTWGMTQTELDRIAALLNERVAGRTLGDVRALLAREAQALRQRADRLLARAIEVGSRALAAADEGTVDIVIATRLALLDQPEFHDPRRIRDLFEAIETKERLIEVLEGVLERDRVCVAFGDEVDEPALRHCALVATHYGGRASPLGVLGVIGPCRMDYRRVIPMVDYISQLVTEKLGP